MNRYCKKDMTENYPRLIWDHFLFMCLKFGIFGFECKIFLSEITE
jgi:hypothetical protein